MLPRGFTLRNYQELFADTDFWLAIGRTLILCAVSVLITIVLLLLAMYPITVMNRRLGKYMQFICMIPYALQGVILSISIISIYAGMNGVLSNRMFMLFGAYSILVLPYIYQAFATASTPSTPKPSSKPQRCWAAAASALMCRSSCQIFQRHPRFLAAR